MKFMYFSIEYRYSNILLKKNINFILTVCFAAVTLVIVLTWFPWRQRHVINVRLMLSPALSK